MLQYLKHDLNPSQLNEDLGINLPYCLLSHGLKLQKFQYVIFPSQKYKKWSFAHIFIDDAHLFINVIEFFLYKPLTHRKLQKLIFKNKSEDLGAIDDLFYRYANRVVADSDSQRCS